MYGAAAGALIQGYGAIRGAQDKSSTLDYEAEVQERNARATMVSAKLNSDKMMMQFRKIQGNDIANYGASGVDQSSGSVLAVLGSNAESAEIDKQNLLYGGQIRAINYENQASIDRVAASRTMTAGYLSALGGLSLAGTRAYAAKSSTGYDDMGSTDG